jgi:hypothetical protein
MVTGGYWISGTSFLKRVTRRIFTISKLFFIEAGRNFILDFINKNSQKILIPNFFKKYCLEFYDPKTYSSRDSILFTIEKFFMNFLCFCGMNLFNFHVLDFDFNMHV